MIAALKELLAEVEAWPEKDQEALAEAAQQIAAQRARRYVAPRDLSSAGLRRDWYSANWEGTDPNSPGIYEWRIADNAVYIGQALSALNRSRRYANNVRRLLNGLPYHIQGRDYR